MSKSLVLLVCVCTVSACISAPKQTLELADVIAEQSASLERSHRQIVDAYFAELERRIDDFVDNQWTPDFLGRAVNSDQVRTSLQDVQAGLGIDPDRLRTAVRGSRTFSEVESDIVVRALENAQFDYRAQFGQIMLDFSQAAIVQINIQRRKLKEPLADSRRGLLGALNEGYANLQSGQSTLRAYLASVVDVVQQQDEVLKKLNLIDERDAIVDGAISASDAAAKGAETLGNITRRFENLIDSE